MFFIEMLDLNWLVKTALSFQRKHDGGGKQVLIGQFLRLPRPGVFEGDGAVEDQFAGGALLVQSKIGQALELIAQFGPGVLQAWLAFGRRHFQGVRVEMLFEIPGGVRFGDGEKAVVEADLRVQGVGGADPVDGALDFAGGVGAAGAAVEVGGAMEFGNLAIGVFHHFIAPDDEGVFEADFAAGFEPEEFRGRRFHEILALDEQFAAEGDFAPAGGFVLGIVDSLEFLHFAFGKIGDDDLEGPQHGQAAQGALVQVLADGVFEDGDVGDAVIFGDADVVGEMAQGLGGDAAAAQAGDGGHAGVVPAGDNFIVDELEELAFAHDGVAQAEAGELVLMRQGTREIEAFQEPIVEGAVDFKFQGADAVGDAFQVVAQAMGEIVHGIDAPGRAGVMMFGVADAVDDRVAQPDVGGGHVNFGAQGAGAVGELAVLHALQQVQVFRDGAVAKGAVLAGTVGRAAVGVGVAGGEVADVGFAFFDEGDGVVVELGEIVGGVERLAGVADCGFRGLRMAGPARR